MSNPTSTERTFQGVFLNLINNIIDSDNDSNFNYIVQEQNVGVGENRFADCLLYSKKDSGNITLFELKDTNWDATDEILVRDAMMKSANRGYKYFVTGTPRQLVIFQTFKPNTTIFERKLKIYYLSNVKSNDEVLLPSYEKLVTPNLKRFLQDLDNLVHEIKEIHWDSIDKYFVNKLSAYILEASAVMHNDINKRILSDNNFKNELKEYLKSQDIFNVGLNFNSDDVYNICQLSNYLLYLKIIFYSYLYKEVSSLKLNKLEIPIDHKLLNKILRKRFDEVLKYDYEMIFQPSVLDEFIFPEEYIPVFKRNVDEIQNLNFYDLNCDIIGAIYNTLIDNQEQHNRGQHFTNVNEVDIINSFCININTEYILDSGCGAGTFLVRAYVLKKYFNQKLNHESLLERLWGIEIAPFPAFLSVMNLTLLDISSVDNYPVIIQKDFSEIKTNYKYKGFFLNTSKIFNIKRIDNKHSEVKIPDFDVCIGNPPYIRQELIDEKDKWIDLAELEHNIKKFNQQSDLYVYYLMHTSSFLKENGRLGYVISSSWLDVSFGTGLQKFLLDNFKIIAILDNQSKRSFETASINTIILILEKCSEKNIREQNNIRFIRIFKDYDYYIGKSDNKYRFKKVIKFINELVNFNSTYKSDDYHITIVHQKDLEKESTYDGIYENGNWGAKYLRSPEIFNKIITKSKDKLIPLNIVVDVKRGFTTGANEFFYVLDETEKAIGMEDDEFKLTFGFEKSKNKINWEFYGNYYSDLTKRHYVIERRFFQPLFKSQKEAINLDIDLNKLKYQVLICNETKASLRKYKNKLLKYIEDAESLNIHKRPTCSQRISKDKRQDWFNLGEELFIGDFIFPSKVGEKYRLIDNRTTQIYCDKVNYNIKVKNEYSEFSDILFLILNSITFRFFFDLFSRQLTGSQTLSDVDVNVVERTSIIDPRNLEKHKNDLNQILKSFKNREQETLFEEIKKEDRKLLDEIILNEMGLNKSDVNELYSATCNYVKERSDKSKSVSNNKSKKKLSFKESVKIISDRFPEIYRYNELIKEMATKKYYIPNLIAIYSKDNLNVSDNLFSSYKVIFKEGNKKTTVSFSNLGQLQIFYFFYDKLEVKGQHIEFPVSIENCLKVFNILISDFNDYIPKIKSFLKISRISADCLSVYREIIVNTNYY